MSDSQSGSLRATLGAQAEILDHIRAYFAAADVIAVDTQSLRDYGVTDPSVENMSVCDESGAPLGYLQFSPEFAMKQLLAAGSGDIYQICRAFRASESGRLHRSEFRILEWYRLGFDHHRLMDEVEALLTPLLPHKTWRRTSYAALFREHIGADPHRASNDLLFTRAGLSMDLSPDAITDRSLLFDIIFSHQIQPKLSSGEALFIFDFPKEQAAYALIRDETPLLSSRFELLVDSVELANGYHEVTDPIEQAKRHQQERQRRQSRGLKDIDFDPAFIAALDSGLPACAGVAIGLDRLMMTAMAQDSLSGLEMR